MKKVYLITTGHSPREDISDDLKAHFSEEIEVFEAGAMDPYTVEQVKTDFAPEEGKATFVSRLSNGEMVPFSEEKAMPLVQKCVDRACAEGADVIIILCTSDFPRLKSSVPVLYPGDLEKKVAVSVAGGMKVGYLFPFATHAPGMAESWKSAGLPGSYACYHHSSGAPFSEVIDFFREDDPDFIVLDCMGYSFEMADTVASETGKPLILPRSLLVNTTHMLLGL